MLSDEGVLLMTWHNKANVLLLAGSLFALLGLSCSSAQPRSLADGQTAEATADSSRAPILTPTERLQLAERDPLAFLEWCHKRHVETVRDYRCIFRKQENLDGALGDEEVIEIRYREKPYSVDMHWVENARRAARVTYVAGRWQDDDRALALVKPSGLLGLLAPAGVKRDIHSSDMNRESRRPVDQFGFRNTLELIMKYCRLAKDDPQYGLCYVGQADLDKRPTYVFERHVPYDAQDDTYPDRLLVVHIDCEWLVPTGTFAYADDAKTELLGSYKLTDAEFNVDLTDVDF